MNFSKASPAERAALVRMVSASAKLVITIGRIIAKGPTAYLQPDDVIENSSSEFVDSIIGVQESESETVRESYQ